MSRNRERVSLENRNMITIWAVATLERINENNDDKTTEYFVNKVFVVFKKFPGKLLQWQSAMFIIVFIWVIHYLFVLAIVYF